MTLANTHRRLADLDGGFSVDREAAAASPGYYWVLDSPGLYGVVGMALRLASAPGAPVLIEGERGVGMLELARVIHDADPRARGKRLRTMAASVIGPAEIRGRAPDGTLFIDDVETLRPPAQEWIAGLLAGRTEAARSLRIIAASRHSAAELLRHPGLGQELTHALDVGRLVIPPLRSRTSDILPLANGFLTHFARRWERRLLHFTDAAKRKLLAYTYPANVRELRNIVERAAALTPPETADVGEEAIVVYEEARPAGVRPNLLRGDAQAKGEGAVRLPTLVEMERDYLVMLIRELKGRRTAISHAMGVSYPTVLKKIARHGLDVEALTRNAPAPTLVQTAD